MKNHFFDFDLLGFPEQNNTDISVIGKGDASVLILTLFPKESKAEDQSFMENVLKAANLTPLEDKIFHLHIINEHINLSLSHIAQRLNVKSVIIFGLKLEQLGIRAQLAPYQFVHINKLHIMWAHSITMIREDRAAKKNQKAAALWQALKGQYLESGH